MAERGVKPDYTVGTITLVSGSVNFTATGASLKSADIQGGDTIMTKNGNVLIIDEITGQNAGKLIFPCPAADAGANQPTRIRFQPDGSRIQGAARDLIARWGQTGNVDAFAALAGYLNAVPVFTGAGTMKLVPLTDIQMSDPHGNLAQLAALAKVNNQFIVMGADGAVTRKPINEITDLIENNRLAITGLGAGKFDKPTGSLAQFLRGNGTPQSVVGTATQAAGGAIIQRGSNANGEFIRFADGTQICWRQLNVLNVASEPRTENGQSFYWAQIPWTYPATFITGHIATSTQATGWVGENATGGIIVAMSFSSRSADAANLFQRAWSFQQFNSLEFVKQLAIGRWY